MQTNRSTHNLADRQQRRTNEPEADFNITFVDEAQDEALAQQQANVILEIARCKRPSKTAAPPRYN